EELDRLLGDALDRAPEVRHAFVREACGGDEELVEALRSLLRAAESAGDRLEGPGAAILRSALSERPDERSDPAPIGRAGHLEGDG
ncbi:MAG TPA: hypothetical protein VE173_09760, partial [Longimicrobiales bacterium]|nr:hypothetical protein [Longimicrobiales bacterium]